MAKAVIFDMDGLLIDSEPFWKEVEKEIFALVGIELTYNMMCQTVWLKVIEVVEYWFSRFPWDDRVYPKSLIAEKIVDKMMKLLSEKWEWKPWYRKAIDFFVKKWYKIGLNSASDYRLIETVLERLEIQKYFHVIHSGQDEVYGKPHPGWYIHTAEKLWVSPTECIVFEDSLNGVLSAKSARMRCIAVPEESNWDNPKFAIADRVIHSLEEWDEEKFWNI